MFCQVKCTFAKSLSWGVLKNIALKKFFNLLENACDRVTYLVKHQVWLLKRTPLQDFSGNNYFIEHLWNNTLLYKEKPLLQVFSSGFYEHQKIRTSSTDHQWTAATQHFVNICLYSDFDVVINRLQKNLIDVIYISFVETLLGIIHLIRSQYFLKN